MGNGGGNEGEPVIGGKSGFRETHDISDADQRAADELVRDYNADTIGPPHLVTKDKSNKVGGVPQQEYKSVLDKAAELSVARQHALKQKLIKKVLHKEEKLKEKRGKTEKEESAITQPFLISED